MLYLLPMEHEDEPPPPDCAWRLLTVCSDPEGNNGPLLNAIDALGDNLITAFDHQLRTITRLAATGKPWRELIQDRGSLHDVGDIQITYPTGETRTEKLWQFSHGQMRLLWCYGGGKKVLILSHAMPKTSRKIKDSDREAARQVMQEFVNSREAGNLKIIGDDDHERTLEKLFPKGAGESRVQKKSQDGRRLC
uniref:Uncharacterized protein n=1 Tax=Rhodocyclus tenuis TaxID=1066 RepID=A0A840G719_RHOTE|nr:hypothetical protein [Rhodocyclus tenuis]